MSPPAEPARPEGGARSVIEEVLPGVVGVEAFADDPAATLFPEEEALLTRAVDKRRREFTTVRACARTALGKLGLPPVPILPGARGAPIWPSGVVGSMTHCEGYRACAVARRTEVLALGIDAEPNGPLPDGVLATVSDAAERAWIAELARADPRVSWDRLLFSAKESVYKAWFPLTRRWLGFEDATLTVRPDQRTFEARLLVAGPVSGFTGRWTVSRGLVVTAICVLPG
ncbi:4'-phosphopantetheinyl transferase family protein [Nonomuraea cavernae]|uniref:4'-phosphopantetheinyl transferase family protein n=1 Tax=Nonomuraea cavernae TaxID=2045107 RepID=UPI001CD9B54A|nr:4'-phosphopantetheinyl transferase superfamily protein [Nonomuraea cavernae]MCA2189457.1 4'-phosphopantetheinyl transferase superfamily protein [Nonomuraea cavernae]